MSRYFALDVETANWDQASICQIGVAQVVDGATIKEYNWMIDPEDWFDPFNVSIHGIDAARVQGCKTYDQVHPELQELLDGEIVIHHTAFDKVALSLVAEECEVAPLDIQWVDSARVVRRVFEEFRRGGYGLANMAQHLGFQFEHHDALEDAKATVRIMEACLAKSETGIEEWLTRQFKRADRAGTSGPGFQGAEGNPEGRLYGEQAVFTGSLSMTRNEAAAIAAQEGITVQKGVNKDTTMLVVGIQDPERLKQGESKSSKHLKAEAKIAKGQDIRILTETDFMSLLRLL